MVPPGIVIGGACFDLQGLSQDGHGTTFLACLWVPLTCISRRKQKQTHNTAYIIEQKEVNDFTVKTDLITRKTNQAQ